VSSPAKAPRTQLRVGRLVKAHGLKGALKLELYTDDPDRRFVPGATFALQVPTSSPWHGKTIELTELRWYNAHPVAFFEGVGDRTAAETLVKAILWVDQDPAEPAEDDAWFDFQLVGLTALRDGEPVGRVARVDHLPAQDLLAIDTGDGEVLVPFVKAIVPAVDIAAGTLTLTPPTGLFEPAPDDDPEPQAAAAEAETGAADAEPEPSDAAAASDSDDGPEPGAS
jgi:16S rRNA processing protein RimM